MLERAKSRAAQILARHGGAALLVRTTTTGGGGWDDPVTTTTTHPVAMIEVGLSEQYAGDTLIHAGDVHGVLIPDEPAFVPGLSDRLRLRGHDHTLAGLEPIQPAPGGPTVAWRIHARR